MDILKRELAPLAKEAWDEIDQQAVDVLKTHLSARRVVRVEGPKGWNYTSIPEGRLTLLDQSGKLPVKAGAYQVKPLVETRNSFTLNRWEMDNVLRGARNIQLDSLEDAMKQMALFEEEAVYNGFPEGGIEGLIPSGKDQSMDFGKDSHTILAAMSQAMIRMQAAYVEAPFTLVVGEKAWEMVNSQMQGYPLIKQIRKMIGGDVIFSSVVKDAVLMPYDHEDLELMIGGDYSIGYEAHDSKEVKLFVAASFTFRVLNPDLVVPFRL